MMFFKVLSRLLSLLLVCVSSKIIAAESLPTDSTSRMHYSAMYTADKPIIDGFAHDSAWSGNNWFPLNYLILGDQPSSDDFSGRFKLRWSSDRIYLLVEIVDDVLMDSHPNPLVNYWDDDALEIFIDEDNSGGIHQFNYNAFAYHVALDNHAVDIGPYKTIKDKAAGKAFIRLFPDHIESRWQRSAVSPYTITWEVSMAVFDKNYTDAGTSKPVTLTAGKQMGFMLAYCDADSAKGREHFINSQDIPALNGDKNRGYIDASVFGLLTLTTE